jgi:hypothetical protein
VQAFARQHWQAAALRAVVVGDWAAAGDSVKTLDAPGGVLRLPQGKLDLDRATLQAP